MAEDVQEPAADPQVRELLQTAWKAIYWIVWPIAVLVYWLLYYLAFAVLFLLKLVYRPLEFILLPVIYFAQFLFACLLAPFQVLAKFETLYIYLGIGALIGGALGLLLALIYGSMKKPLGLDSKPEPQGRTAKQYREEKHKRKAKSETPIMSPGYLSPSHLSMSDSSRRAGRGKGLLSQTIMEEVDSDY